MGEDNSHSSNGSSSKSLWTKVTQAFTGEPQNKDELVEVLNDAEDRDLIRPETKLMIQGVLAVSDMRVRDIMIPRSQMVTLDINDPIEESIPKIVESGHSRFPVINEDIDKILVHALTINDGAAAIKKHAEGCDGCPSCLL